MGVHEAHHLARANRIIHWLAIPIELFAAAKLLSLARIGPIDLAFVAAVLLGIVYIATDLLAGALMIALLFALRALALSLTSGSVAIDAVASVVLFVVAFTVQTRVGHGVFEKGIDDTNANLAELRRTKNPIPILLVFYYHLVELLFAVGYRPALRAQVEKYRDEEIAKMQR